MLDSVKLWEDGFIIQIRYMDQFARTQLLLGEKAMEKLKNSRVAVFGVGGVGGYSVEALARSGVGAIDIIDDDKVCLTNINRQIIADTKSIGKYKVDVAKERILSINQKCKVTTYRCFYLLENASEFDFSNFDYRTLIAKLDDDKKLNFLKDEFTFIYKTGISCYKMK